MLFDQDPLRQRFWRVIVSHRHGRLQHDRPRVQLRRDDVNGGATDFHAVLPGLVLSVEAWERGQQRGVNIKDGVGVGFDELRAEQAHEARQADEAHFPLLERRDDGAVEIFA